MTVLLDSNVYIYALDASDEDRHMRALGIMRWHLQTHATVARQVIGEVLAVAHRKRPNSVAKVRAWVEDLTQTCVILPTDDRHLSEASVLAERCKIQFWDAVLCTVARRAGGTMLLSEDFQDGLRIGTLTIVNPFASANRDIIDEIVR